MLDRMTLGRVPEKPHLAFHDAAGALLYEHCVTRQGFEGGFSMLYHQRRPHEAEPEAAAVSFALPAVAAETGLMRRHFRCLSLDAAAGPALSRRVPLLASADAVIGFARSSSEDSCYFSNADADELFFVLSGRGLLRSAFGDLAFRAGDYVAVPKGTLYRLVLEGEEELCLLTLECQALGLLARYRNALGQLRMDAPYSHRDFLRPSFVGPLDEGIRHWVVKRRAAFHGYRLPHSPLDVVGWDGSLYPFVLPISSFQPRVGQVHLPPPVHATFEAAGVLVCSFVPRPLDFHERANPAPYPHSSVDVDEVLFYVNGAFTSRRGIARGSLSHHPCGIPHGPHPGAYEQAPGQTHTTELAVMFDCSLPLSVTAQASSVEDAGYQQSFRAGPS